jgi:hypothetical protein
MPGSYSFDILIVGCGLGSNSNMGTIYRIRAGFIFPQPSCNASGFTDSPFELPGSSSLGVLFLFRQQR